MSPSAGKETALRKQCSSAVLKAAETRAGESRENLCVVSRGSDALRGQKLNLSLESGIGLPVGTFFIPSSQNVQSVGCGIDWLDPWFPIFQISGTTSSPWTPGW